METVALSVHGLVDFVLRCGSIDSRFSGFDRANEGSRIHRRLQKEGGKQYKAEVALRAVRTVDGIRYELEGRADGVITDENGVTVDEIKTTTVPSERLTEDFSPLHWAQAKCYAAFLCDDLALGQIVVQLTYFQVDTEEIIRHRRVFTAKELEDFLTETLHLYTPWARFSFEWEETRNKSIQTLAFPFPAYRPGQYKLAGAVYRTVAESGRLFACAPTGIGKTVSTLFPSLKAMGAGLAGRIFYLTAKNITRKAAEDTLALLRHSDEGLRVKSVSLTAKDKVCFLEQRDCTPEACPYANGYYDRVNDALLSFVQKQDEFTRDTISAFCRKNLLCPFEFALDLALFSDCIIGDYNYLFDPVASLKRFFGEGAAPCNNIFLIDEAHNLVDRARDMYSVTISKASFLAVKKELGKTSRKLSSALKKVNDAFLEQGRLCGDATERMKTDGLPELVKLLTHFCTAAQEYMDEHREGNAHQALLQLYFDVQFYLRIAELYDEHFTTLIEHKGNDVRITQLCLDAAPFLDASMAQGRASVLFSATLSPSKYYVDTLGGGEHAKRTWMQNPFDPARLCLLTADGISTKYADRDATLPAVCHMILAAVRAHAGHYLIYFSSYAYLRNAQTMLKTMAPDITFCAQEAGMDEPAREAFLAQFSQGSATLAGLCVLGGAFSEGIDLAGEKLIGSIIVGVGLPQLCTQRDALRDYYNEKSGSGFDYAYRFPGMNKVLQAAGRVIRTQSDRGMVLLIDSRYAQSGYRSLFPPHWSHCRSVANDEAVTAALAQFWSESEDAPS